MNFRRIYLGVLILSGLYFSGCQIRKEVDVSSDPQYAGIIGKEYRTKGDFVLFKFHKEDTQIELERPGTTNLPSLTEMAGKKFPFEYGQSWIVGILPKGGRFKITKVIRVQGNMDYLYYDAIVTEGKGYEGWAIVPSWLGTSDFMPKFKPELVEEVPMGK